MTDDRLLTASEVAAAINEPLVTVRRWIYEGVLASERVGPYRRVRVRLSTLRRMYPPDTIRLPPERRPAP